MHCCRHEQTSESLPSFPDPTDLIVIEYELHLDKKHVDDNRHCNLGIQSGNTGTQVTLPQYYLTEPDSLVYQDRRQVQNPDHQIGVR